MSRTASLARPISLQTNPSRVEATAARRPASAAVALQTNPSRVEATPHRSRWPSKQCYRRTLVGLKLKTRVTWRITASYRRTLVGLKLEELVEIIPDHRLQTNPSRVEANWSGNIFPFTALLQTNPSRVEAIRYTAFTTGISGYRRTLVGLKPLPLVWLATCSLGYRRTLVGLKPPSNRRIVLCPRRYRRTLVGLKLTVDRNHQQRLTLQTNPSRVEADR